LRVPVFSDILGLCNVLLVVISDARPVLVTVKHSSVGNPKRKV
jgi:hypothetical protein